MNIGENIKKYRKLKGLKQSELAELSSISRVSIGNYERGDRTPNIDAVGKIANALEIPMKELITDKLERKKILAKSRYDKYISIPENHKNRLIYYKKYYRNQIKKTAKEENCMSNMGNRIKVARVKKGINQDELCELVGITRSTLSKLEQGKLDPKLSLMKNISVALDSTVEFLFLNEAENEPIKFKGMNKSNKIYRSFMEDIITNLQDVEYMTTSLIGEIENILNI